MNLAKSWQTRSSSLSKSLVESALDEGGILVCPVNDYGAWQSKLCRKLSEKITDPEQWYLKNVRYKKHAKLGDCLWSYDNVRKSSDILIAMPILFTRHGFDKDAAYSSFFSMMQGISPMIEWWDLKFHLPPIGKSVAEDSLKGLSLNFYDSV